MIVFPGKSFAYIWDAGQNCPSNQCFYGNGASLVGSSVQFNKFNPFMFAAFFVWSGDKGKVNT